MRSYSSSSVTDTSPSPLDSLAAAWPMAVSTAETGAKKRIKKHSEPAVPRLNRSLYFLAILLGSISPRKNRTRVVATVPQTTAPMPQW